MKLPSIDEGDIKPAYELIRAQYPFSEQTRLPIKLSVSEVKGMRERDPEAMPLISEFFGRKRPAFLKERIGGNVVGNAVHKFMQFADFRALDRPNGFKEESRRLLEHDFLTQREIDLVPKEQVLNFVMQPLFRDMLTADYLEKEKRFYDSRRRIYENMHRTCKRGC